MNNIIKFTTFILFITTVLLVMYFAGQKMRKIHKLTNGKIISYNNGGKGYFGPGINYVYQENNLNIHSSRRHGELKYSIQDLKNHFFPVVYQKYWFGNFDVILITPNDFAYYGYPFPDSLKWVLPYIRK